MNNIDICDGEIEVLFRVVNMVLDKVLDGRAEVGVDPVVLPGDSLAQLLVVDLDVPHGHLKRVPLGLVHQLLGRLELFGLGVSLVSPLIEEVLELLLTKLGHLILDMVGVYLSCCHIHHDCKCPLK